MLENRFKYFTKEEIKEIYKEEVDKTECPNFEKWVDDMVKMKIFIKE